MRTSLVLAALAACGLATAQAQPDFSGRWILAEAGRGRQDVPRALTVRQSVARTTVRGEPMDPFFTDIAIDREFENGARADTYPIGVLGGTVPGVRKDGSRMEGPRGHQAVAWDVDALVFESGSYTGETPGSGSWTERRERWTLEADGRLRIAITTAGSGETSRTVTLMYRRP